MKSSIFSRLSTVQLFVGLAGGLAFYLTPQDARSFLQSPMRECYIAGLTALISLALLVIFRSYETVGLSMVTGMLFLMVGYISGVIHSLLEQIELGKTFSLNFNYQEGICWVLIWTFPLVVCMIPRLIAVGQWDSPEKREDFARYFRLVRGSFCLFYTILLLSCFIFNRSVDFYGDRVINMIPFYQIPKYFSSGYDTVYFLLGNLLFFTPIGFFSSIAKPQMRWWCKLLIALGIGVTIELSQLLFNTGMVDIDDVLLNAVGVYLGYGIKWILDYLRSWLSEGKEKKIAYLLPMQKYQKDM